MCVVLYVNYGRHSTWLYFGVLKLECSKNWYGTSVNMICKLIV